MGSVTRMNTPISKWAFPVLIIMTLFIVLTKFYETWPWVNDMTSSYSVKDVYYEWRDNLSNVKGVVHYQEILPKGKAKLDVLLLHGMRFTSTDWVELDTLNILAENGYRVIALDLPNHGKSTYKLLVEDKRSVVRFLDQFIQKIHLNSLVIVSPSASGVYSLPYIAASKSVKGLVAIAATGTDRIPLSDFHHFPQTLIVRGSKDKNLGVTSTNTLRQNLPHYSVEVIKEAGHACYIEKPKQFHAILLKFLQTISIKSVLS